MFFNIMGVKETCAAQEAIESAFPFTIWVTGIKIYVN